jgi:Spy/CpxP family protein refolding chaperone
MFLGGGLLGEATLRPFARALDLTDEQRDRIQAIVASRKDAFEALRERAQPAREALRAAMVATPIDESAIRARIAELSQTGADLAVLGAQVRAEVRDVLTDAQRTTLEELQKTARPRGPRFGEGRGTRPGAR